jgi:hydroxyacylglutathione hydrolase
MLPKPTAAPAPEAILDFGPIRLIPGRKGGRYPYCHSLVLEGDEVWVVDPASDKDYLRHLARTREVTAVFISHFHEDHQKYNYLFPRARFYVPALEVAAFTSLEGIFDLMGLDDPQFQEYWGETLVKDFHFQPLANLAPYQPHQSFHNGPITLEVIPTPGHTPGHSGFYFPGQDLLFLADVDLTPFGPWYGDAASDLGAYETTLAQLEHFQAQTFITAHEQGVFTPAEARAGLAYFRQVLREREAQLLELLRKPQTLAQLVARRLIYDKPKEPPFVYNHMEAQMLKKHLDRLRAQGLIVETPEGYLTR